MRCMYSRADADCTGGLTERELDAFDAELSSLARTVPGVRPGRIMECRERLPSSFPQEVSLSDVEHVYIPCRVPRLQLD